MCHLRSQREEGKRTELALAEVTNIPLMMMNFAFKNVEFCIENGGFGADGRLHVQTRPIRLSTEAERSRSRSRSGAQHEGVGCCGQRNGTGEIERGLPGSTRCDLQPSIRRFLTHCCCFFVLIFPVQSVQVSARHLPPPPPQPQQRPPQVRIPELFPMENEPKRI